MSRSPLTFGVEFEFVLGWIPNELPGVPEEKRTYRFTPTAVDTEYTYEGLTRGSLGKTELAECRRDEAALPAMRHIAETIWEAGFPINCDDFDRGDIKFWEITTDTTIQAGDLGQFDYLPIEVKSPAYVYSVESLKAIEAFCHLMTDNYCVSFNKSTGLHVHVGSGGEGFTFSTVQNLVAFLWAFEPQLETLHPPARLCHDWAHSMRDLSVFSIMYQKDHGKRPDPYTGLVELMHEDNIEELLCLQENHELPKRSAYNFNRLFHDFILKDQRTIEFRQHEGTIDGERISNWIQTVVGIVDFAKDMNAATLTNLYAITKMETWEKLGDGLDDQREQRMGPILAEGASTIIDLLKEIKLFGPAEYYRDKWYKHMKQPKTMAKIVEPQRIFSYENRH